MEANSEPVVVSNEPSLEKENKTSVENDKNSSDNINEAVATDRVDLKNNDIDSLVHIESSDVNDDTNVNSNQNSHPVQDNNPITKSTVLLTNSQILESDQNSGFVELGDSNTEKETENFLNSKNPNTDSIILTSFTSDNSELSSPTKVDDKIKQTETVEESVTEQNPVDQDNDEDVSSEEEEKAPTEVTEKKSEAPVVQETENANKSLVDDDNFDKDYEIPTFTDNNKPVANIDLTVSKAEDLKDELEDRLSDLKKNIIENEIANSNQPVESPTETVSEKPKRNIEQEDYEKILGNDSLLKKITQYGEDARPINGHMVTISYEAFIKDSLKSVEKNENLSFILGDGDVISGLDMVVSLMDRNERCEAIVEARHAYGSLGKQPDIPANTTLLYKVHLISFQDVTDFSEMQPIERLSLAEAKKIRGNFHYNRQDFHLAILSYKKGLRFLDDDNYTGGEEAKDLEKFNELSQTLLINIALSNFKMGENREALNALDRALGLQGNITSPKKSENTDENQTSPKPESNFLKNYIKALYIKGKVLLQSGETSEAIKSLTLASQHDPNNIEVKKELAKAQAKHKQQYENEKQLYKKMISGVGTDLENESKKGTNATAKKTKKSANNSSNSLSTYLATGIVVAVVGVGIAFLARYKNLI